MLGRLCTFRRAWTGKPIWQDAFYDAGTPRRNIYANPLQALTSRINYSTGDKNHETTTHNFSAHGFDDDDTYRCCPRRSLAIRAEEAIQISGLGAYAAPGQCTDPEGAGADYVLIMTGAFSGCHYAFVETSKCSPGGAYFEAGTETFIGTYNGEHGTFQTNYVFTATYQDCPTFVGEIAGRCQHPIVDGSGTGVFEGVTGRFDMKDDVEVGNFPYRGHLSF